MRFYDDHVTDVHIAYIGGGSRGWAWGLMNDLALESRMSGDMRLFDINQEASGVNEKLGNNLGSHPAAAGAWRYKAAETLDEALAGANFVVISILPGTFENMASDVHAPEKFGIYQPVGDSTGPGGLIRAMRTIPMYVLFAQKIQEHCPEAWVINYTNPMTVCVRTLYQVFPGIKAFGCCHEVFGTQGLLARILKDSRGVDASRNDIKVNILGINHFTWFDKADCKGENLMPLFRDFAEKYHEQGFDGPPPDAADAYFSCGHRVKMDLFRRYGLIAAAGDRHLAEFCPPWYLKTPEMVIEWQFRLTPVSFRVQDAAARAERAKRLLSGEEAWPLKPSGEEGVLQMKALLGLGDLTTNVNFPNRGQVAGIPSGCVVESNVLISRDSVQPLQAGRLPDDVGSLVMRQVVNQETIVQAGLREDEDLAFRAFANDALMTASICDARKLFREMMQASCGT